MTPLGDAEHIDALRESAKVRDRRRHLSAAAARRAGRAATARTLTRRSRRAALPAAAGPRRCARRSTAADPRRLKDKEPKTTGHEHQDNSGDSRNQKVVPSHAPAVSPLANKATQTQHPRHD